MLFIIFRLPAVYVAIEITFELMYRLIGIKLTNDESGNKVLQRNWELLCINKKIIELF